MPRTLSLAILLVALLKFSECGYLQWSLGSEGATASSASVTPALGSSANYPLDSPFPPIILKAWSAGSGGLTDVVVLFTERTASGWTLAGLEVTRGYLLWSLALLAGPSDSPRMVTAGSATRQPSNQLNLAFFLLDGKLHAVNATGSLLWTRAWSAPAAATQLSGWQGLVGGSGEPEGGALYLSEVQPPSPNAPSLFRNTTVAALAAGTGAQLWVANLTAVGTAAFGVTPIRGVAAAPALALYANTNKVAAVEAASGKRAWEYQWALPGTGLAPNITDLQYVELPGTGDRLILLTSMSWQQQRYVVLRLEARGGGGGAPASSSSTAGTQSLLLLQPGALQQQAAPVSVAWQSAQPEAAMEAYPALAAPTVSAEKAAFYYWTNQTIYYPAVTWEMALVARSLLTGAQLWRLALPRAQQAGADELPVAAPAALYDRLFIVTTAGLKALGGGSGGEEWGVGGSPVGAVAGAGPGGHSFNPGVTFTNNASYLVAMRCLGEGSPAASLCVYGGYERAAATDTSSAATRGATAGLAVAAAAAAAALAGVLGL